MTFRRLFRSKRSSDPTPSKAASPPPELKTPYPVPPAKALHLSSVPTNTPNRLIAVTTTETAPSFPRSIHPDNPALRPRHHAYLQAPPTLACAECRAPIATVDLLVSGSFRGRHGPCFFVKPPRGEPGLINVDQGEPYPRLLQDGKHTFAEVTCKRCSGYLGWRYLDVERDEVKYKVGNYCIEMAMTRRERRLHEVEVGDLS